MTGIRFIPSSTGAGSRVGIGLSSIVGPTGAIGYQGYQGPAGVASMTGATGLQGFQGLIGATGAGFQGLQGYFGPTGPSNPGVQGFQGLIGATGPSNPGVQGFQGLVGSTGSEGQVGLQGLIGATGSIGFQGFQGLVGSTGAAGSIGPQGGAGMGFVVFANTTSYTGLNQVIATGGNVGQFVLVLGGDLFVYSGTGAGSTGPGVSYQYAGDVTDESKLVGLQGAMGSQGFQGFQGLVGLQGAIYTGPFVDISFSGNMSGANAYLQNLAAENAAFQGAQLGFNGLLVVGPTTLIGALQATGGINAPSATIKDLVVTGSITLPTGTSLAGPQGTQGLVGLQGSQGLIGLQGSQYTGPFTDLTVSGLTSLNNVQITGFMTGTSASLSYLKVTDLVVGGETGGSLYINTGVISNLNVMNQIITGELILATGATIGSAGDTIFTDASLNVANVFTVNAYNGDVTATGTFVGASGAFSKFKASEATITSLSSTTANIGTANITTIPSTTIGSFTATTGTITNLTSTNLTSTTATVSGTSYLLGDVISSGNMSGTNAYFQNLAAQNIASQGSQVGFNGLLVVGPTTLIGTLNATGGLTTTTATANSATIKDLVVTSSIILPTGTSLAGPQGSQGLAGPQGSQGLIGPQGSQYTGPFIDLTVSGLTSLNNVQITGFMTGTSASLSYLKVTDLVVGGETGGSLYINTGVISNLNVMNQIITGELILATGATIGSAGDTIFTDASFNVANVFTVNAYNGDVTVVDNLVLGTGAYISSSSDTMFTDASLNIANVFTVNAFNADVTATGTFVGASGAFSKFKATTATIDTLSSTTATIGTANITTIPSTTIGSFTATTGTIANLTSTSLTSTTATVSGTSYLTDVMASGNMSGANAYFQNMAAQNIASQGSQVGFNGLLVVGPTTLIGSLQATGGLSAPTATITSLTAPTLSSTTLSSSNATITSLTAGNILPLTSDTYTLGSTGALWKGIYVGTGSVHIGDVTLSAPDNKSLVIDKPTTVTSLTASTGTITSLTAPFLTSTTGTITNLTSTNATMSNLTVTNLVVGGETGGILYVNTGVASNLTVMNQIITGELILATGATIGSAGDTIFTDASFNVANVFTVNAYNWDVMATGSLRASSGSFGKLKVDSELHLATGAIVTGNLTLATGSSIGSSSDTLFTDASLNVANIFTVNAYNGDVISTGTFIASSGSFSKLNATTATVSGTTYLTDTISSGNMSGANGYFLNLAGQNLACQGASVGFSGLNVVGTSSLIGMMYATGGINSQGVTTTTLNTNTGSITNLSAGNILPLANDTYTLGSTGAIWKSIYVGTGSLHIGNVTLSAPDNQSLLINKPVTLDSLTVNSSISLPSGNLSSTNATFTTLNATTGSITNLVSSVMTGTNIYAGNLNATTLSVSYSGATGSSNSITSTKTRGKVVLIHDGSATGAFVNNNLVTVDSFVSATITNSCNAYISYIDITTNQFSIYLNTPPSEDAYINWMVIN